jgi:hypothetical protein
MADCQTIDPALSASVYQVKVDEAYLDRLSLPADQPRSPWPLSYYLRRGHSLHALLRSV